jgi:preprotein translocase subunit YajC
LFTLCLIINYVTISCMDPNEIFHPLVFFLFFSFLLFLKKKKRKKEGEKKNRSVALN